MKSKITDGRLTVKTLHLGVIILSLFLQVFPQSGVSSSCKSNKNLRYPNELADFRLYEKSKWKSLTFLESTMDDVRQVMGEPSKSIDTAQLAIPYPGDPNSIQPLFIYEDEQWEMSIYFGKYCYYTSNLSKKMGNRLCQVVLSPKKDISFDKFIFPAIFEGNTKKLPGSSWDEYKDECGLIYIINQENSADKKSKAILESIMYGPTKAELQKQKKSDSFKAATDKSSNRKAKQC